MPHPPLSPARAQDLAQRLELEPAQVQRAEAVFRALVELRAPIRERVRLLDALVDGLGEVLAGHAVGLGPGYGLADLELIPGVGPAILRRTIAALGAEEEPGEAAARERFNTLVAGAGSAEGRARRLEHALEAARVPGYEAELGGDVVALGPVARLGHLEVISGVGSVYVDRIRERLAGR